MKHPYAVQAQSNDEIVGEVVEELSETAAPLVEFARDAWTAVVTQLTSLDGAIEAGVLLASLPLAWLLARLFKGVLTRRWSVVEGSIGARVHAVLVSLLLPLLWAGLLWAADATLIALNYQTGILAVLRSLLVAWVFINAVTGFVRDRFVARLFATFAWLAAALNILGLLTNTLNGLDSVALGAIGEKPLTLLGLFKVIVLAVLFLWIASAVSALVKTSLSRSERLTPSVQTLVTQGARGALFFAAIMFALSAVGIDLTVFAVFSGAIGVGIGFGLQSIFSNLMAGIILLLEKSIKVGDFVEFDSGLAGEVQEINIRATRVTTNDNVDILVPNEEFIKTRVTNWTLRDAFRRMRIPFGVAYGTDKELVKKAALEAAAEVPHNLDGPGAREPQVWLSGFGDSSLDFELVVWIRPESVKRPSKVLADYNWAIESALAKYGIEIPFPQRDLNIRGTFMGANFDSAE